MKILISQTTTSFHQIHDFAHCAIFFSAPTVFNICILLLGLGLMMLL